MHVLYVTHYGLLEPLGQSQILPYLKGLAQLGVRLQILSFEKPAHFSDGPAVEGLRSALGALGIAWHPRVYRKGASLRALAEDSFTTAIEIQRRSRETRFDLLHCRSHVPAIMGWAASALRRIPMLFDFRGFTAEEYVDAGLWKPGDVRFRITKGIERLLMRRAAAVVALTSDAGAYLRQQYGLDAGRVFIIPCCVDLQRFRPDEGRLAAAAGSPLRLVYSGSTVGRYNMDGMIRFLTHLRKRRPGSRLTILSSGDPSGLERAVARMGLPRDAVRIHSLPQPKVAAHLIEHDLGLIFMRHSLALLATSPTKLGEYLACGVPVVAEEGLGDLSRILPERRVGFMIDSHNPSGWSASVDSALELSEEAGVRRRCVAAARELFALDRGVAEYQRCYESACRPASP